MSQENVETVERAIAAINARDIDAYLACCTENVELLLPMVGAQYLGSDGIRRFFSDIEDIGPDFRIEVQRVQAIGDSNAIAFLRVSSTGRASGIVTGAESANVYDFTEGRISRVHIFLDRSEALKAVGLEEYAMSENLDLVRSIFADWERGEYRSIGWAHPEIENEIVGGPSPGTWRGLAGMAEGWRDFLSAWEDVRFGADEYRELDGERVLVLTHASGHGRTSGLEVGQLQSKGANLFQIQDGKVTRHVAYLQRDLAFADLGLEE
jgi:ketosteroid isomerase-like protein